MIFVSDLHMGKGDRSDDFSADAEGAYLRLLKYYWSHRHFIVGDGLELQQASQEEVREAHSAVFDAFESLPFKGRIELIPGNHDIELPGPDRKILEVGNVRILVLHGHQYDWANKTGGGLGKLVTQVFGFLERHINDDIDEWACWFMDKVNDRVEEYDHAMAKMAKEDDCGVVIYGHTHKAATEKVDGVFVVNCGTWTRKPMQGYPFAELETDGTVSLKWWAS